MTVENPHCEHPGGTCAATPFLEEIQENQEIIAIYLASIKATQPSDLTTDTFRSQFELWHQGIEEAKRAIAHAEIELKDADKAGLLCSLCPHR